ncbi:MAG: hypothetical protein J5855_05645 [Mailhella sp.]|nr:hypothetical protein [Mailhella sp.]
MPNSVSLNFNDIVRMADAAPDKNIVVKDGGFKSVGKIGAFFTSKTNCRLAAQAFLDGLKAQYGDSVAHALAPELRVLQSSGKALSARTVKELVRQAGELSRGLAHLNGDMAQTFVNGTGIAGDTRNLDSAFADYCAAKGMDPAGHAVLKQAVAGAVKDLAKNSPRLMSFAELSEAVRSMDTLPEMQKSVEVHKFLDGHIGADLLDGIGDQLRGLAAANGLDAAQTAELTDIAGMVLRHAASGHDGPVTHEFLAAALQNDLAVASYLHACGGPAPRGSSVLSDIIGLTASSPLQKDAVLLVSQFGDGYMPAYMAALENMPRIRALQPDGIPTRETIWQACFNEPLPDGFGGKSQHDFNNAVFDKLESFFKAANGGDEGKTAAGMMAYGSGISLRRSLDSMNGPVALSLGDFVLPPTVTPLQRVPTLEKCEEILARDIHRRGWHMGIKGYDPVITFAAPGQAAETLRIKDVSALNEQEKADYNGEKPSPVSHGLVARARALCGGNEAQLRQVVLNMSQAGTGLLRMTSAVTGIYVDEHSPIDIDVRRQADGIVTMRYHTPAASPLDIDYTCTVTPDGRGAITDFRMVPRPDAPPAPPAPGASVPPEASTASAATEEPAAPAAG